MWKRKVMKKRSRISLKQNYWKAVSVCFLIAVLTAAYPLSTTFLSLRTGGAAADVPFTPEVSNSQTVFETVRHFFNGTFLQDFYQGKAGEAVGFLTDLLTPVASPFFSVLRTVNNVVTEDLGPALIFPLAGIAAAVLYQIFVNNILLIGEKRFFLETHNYHRTPVSKIFFLYKLRCLANPAWIMLCRTFFQFLWGLTIIGGVIKHYEYCMIPFILAENPKISRKNAFFLSRQLTHRNKWKLFLLDLSFLGWRILSVLTLGLLDFFYVNPYITGCKAELYLSLRRNYVLSRASCYECLNDSTLEHVPTEDELLIMKALYDDSQGPYTKMTSFEADQYPAFLFSIQPPLCAVRYPVNAGRKYDLLSYLFLFFAFSIFGWLLETLICLFRSGALPDTLLLFGPWSPMYGICGILLLTVMKKLMDKSALVFILNLILYSAAEYLVNWIAEAAPEVSAVDYSSYLMSLNGRVYAGTSIVFALLGCAFLYYLAPRWDSLFTRLPRTRRRLICAVLSLLFLADLVLSIYSRAL